MTEDHHHPSLYAHPKSQLFIQRRKYNTGRAKARRERKALAHLEREALGADHARYAELLAADDDVHHWLDANGIPAPDEGLPPTVERPFSGWKPEVEPPGPGVERVSLPDRTDRGS